MENPINSVKDYVSRYVKLRVEEVRLESMERVVNVMGYIVFASIAFLFVFALFCFGLLALGTYLGEILENATLGYLAVAGIMLVLVILLFLMKKKLTNAVAGSILSAMTKTRNKKTN